MLRRLVPEAISRLPQALANPRTAVEQAIAASPLAPARTFWDALRQMEPWWPVLIPVLLWVFWRTYQRERATLREGREQP